METAAGQASCGSCGAPLESDPGDRAALCRPCRQGIVRRSTWLAVLPALLIVALYVWLLSAAQMFDSRFVIVWIALGIALAWVGFKLSRRVLFDVVRGRRVHSGP